MVSIAGADPGTSTLVGSATIEQVQATMAHSGLPLLPGASKYELASFRPKGAGTGACGNL